MKQRMHIIIVGAYYWGRIVLGKGTRSITLLRYPQAFSSYGTYGCRGLERSSLEVLSDASVMLDYP